MEIQILAPPLNFDPRPEGVAPALIVMHSTALAEEDDCRGDKAISVLRERGLSYHYIIAKSGHVFQCVAPELRARHAGSSYGPRELEHGLSRKQDDRFMFGSGISVNDYSIGISFVNLDNGLDPFTEAQTDSAIGLIGDLKARFSTLEWLTSHATVSPGRKVDPLGYDLENLAQATGLKLFR